jgi:hypothetical protein
MSSSNHRKAPGFTFANKTKLPYFKGSEVDFKGSDSPSLSTYTPNDKWIKEDCSKWSQSKKPRFVVASESEAEI